MIFEQLNPGYCLSYLVGSADSNEVAIVDPLLDYVDKYLDLLKNRNLKLTHVIDTHTHADHISGCPKLVDVAGCQYVMHELAAPKCVTLRVSDNSEIALGSTKIKFVHTPGHTRDSMSLVFEDRIITGDVLFLDDGGAGRDDLPGGDPGEHWQSLQKLRALADHLIVFPAHEYRSRKPSPLGEQKQRNPFFKPGSQADYVQYLNGLKLGPADWMKAVLKANIECTRDPKATYIPKDVPACEVMGTAGGSTCSDTDNIAPADLQKRIEAGEIFVLLDVRELKELHSELGHVADIVHIPVNELEARIEELADHKEKIVISICKSGIRAARAAGLLRQVGFKSILVMEGGMVKWNECGLPIKRPEQVT